MSMGKILSIRHALLSFQAVCFHTSHFQLDWGSLDSWPPCKIVQATKCKTFAVLKDLVATDLMSNNQQPSNGKHNADRCYTENL